MDVRRYPRGEDRALSLHFRLSEYECRCGQCSETRVDLEHVERLEILRRELGRPVVITSAYRCPAHNQVVGGHRTSEHMEGTATDVVVRGVEPDRVALTADRLSFPGLGRYDTFTHVDSRDLAYRDGRPARWDHRTGGDA